jgi:hypothetical protein
MAGAVLRWELVEEIRPKRIMVARGRCWWVWFGSSRGRGAAPVQVGAAVKELAGGEAPAEI